MSVFRKTLMSALLGASLTTSVLIAPASAASSEEKRYTHSACEDSSTAVCGVIVYAVATSSYYADYAEVKAHSSQPDSGTIHPKCSGVNKKLDVNIPPGNYDTFVLPASCSYKLKIKIKSGNAKDMNLFLTPGCKIVTKTDGTTSSNSWKSNEVTWIENSMGTGTPYDAAGYKCGKLSGAEPKS